METTKNPNPSMSSEQEFMDMINIIPNDDTTNGEPFEEDSQGQPADEDNSDDVFSKEDSNKEQDKDSQGQPDVIVPKTDEASVASAISKANEKTLRELDTVASLLKDNPEKLEELKESNPKIYERLVSRMPDLLATKDNADDDTSDKTSMLASLLDKALRAQEERDFYEWKEEVKLADVDYKSKQDELENSARTLYEEGLVKDWKQAIRMAGKIIFPHLDSSPVSIEKLNKLKGQSYSPSSSAPAPSDLSEEDTYVMKKNGLSESEYKKIQRGTIFNPWEL